ncbi:ribonuclease domain-containing protein [Streptomyces scabiei]|uniref:ribonuclease domain-containing protein n=1 Tax=Streptomyces scabiei TaxID=1930 RepID=UPI000765D667|nr:ribonuclease domain-containing protein [Streptomyces scabiei]
MQENIYTGGQYFDRDGALRSFMNGGHAGSAAIGYTGTFQEYNTTVYTSQGSSTVPRRDARRIVRAISSGDVWWTDDHYGSFHYLGRF